MADISKRLSNLERRRRGLDGLNKVAYADAETLQKSLLAEAYKIREPTKNYTRYALGAMQAVDSDYTRISKEEADRVGAAVKNGLTSEPYSVTLRLQGSVAADVHSKGVSDVDILTIRDDFVTFHYPPVREGSYVASESIDPIWRLSKLREKSEEILTARYYGATVDTSGAKAINVSGGSLRRPVDVVASLWYDSEAYQSSGQIEDRGIFIFDKKNSKRILNYPFKHIAKLDQGDSQTRGGLKKAIRLCKSVKADAEEDGKEINLSSFDIAALMTHANQVALNSGYANELAILEEVRRLLDWCFHNPASAKSLKVPDGTRVVFDTNEKFSRGLLMLSSEVDELAAEVASEQAGRNFQTIDHVLVKRALEGAMYKSY